MTEPTAEVQAAELVALIADEVRPSLNAYQLNAIEPMLARALHAYRQAGVEQAEKELKSSRAWAEGLKEQLAVVGPITAECSRKELKQRIAALEAELASSRINHIDANRRNISANARAERAEAELARMRETIRTHRDARGDDRCWLDDQTLYAGLCEEQPNTTLPPREKFLANCARFWQSRQDPSQPYETEEDRLRARLDPARLERVAKDLSRALWNLDGDAGFEDGAELILAILQRELGEERS